MKKTTLLIIFVFAFLIIWQNCNAVELLLKYPEIKGVGTLNDATTLPGLINYIYKFALGICGVTALVSIIYGAGQYVFSAGDSSKASDAKDRITQALLGIVILLAAVLILNTINPDLVNLGFNLPKLPTPPPTTSNYPWAQCVISGNNGCPSGQVIYRGCGEYTGYVNNDYKIIKTACEDQCKGAGFMPNATKTCNVYSTQAGCKPNSNTCVNP